MRHPIVLITIVGTQRAAPFINMFCGNCFLGVILLKKFWIESFKNVSTLLAIAFGMDMGWFIMQIKQLYSQTRMNGYGI